MHGHNSAFLKGTGTEQGARALGIPVCDSLADAERAIAASGIVYLPLESIAPEIHALVGLRSILGLRSPVNSMVRLLNPLGAPASTVGVFHPSYRDLHRDTAALLGWRHLAVVKGGGGEFELNPLKAATLHRLEGGKSEDDEIGPLIAEGRGERPARGDLNDLVSLWSGEAGDEIAEAMVIATAAAALATVSGQDPAGCLPQAGHLWRNRDGGHNQV